MPIRVVLAHMPPMLRDIIRDAVRNEADLEIVGTIGEQEPLLAALAGAEADVLILGAGPPDDLTFAKQAWLKSPRLKVLTIAQGGRSAVLHALRPNKAVLGDLSAQGLVAAIREAPAW